MLNHEFLYRKIKLIQEDLARLESLAQCTFEELANDPMKYSAVERYLERIITRAIDINRHCIGELGKGNEVVRSYEDTFLRLADLGVYPKQFAETIAPSAGLRNVLVHEYDDIDKHLVYQSVGQAIGEYGKYCGYLLNFLSAHQ